MRKAAAAALLCLGLAGCAGQAELTARWKAQDDARCQGYGFTPATEGYATCRMSLDQQRRRMLFDIGDGAPRHTTCFGTGTAASCY